MATWSWPCAGTWTLDFLDCSAFGALLRVRAMARRGGGDVVLVAPQPLVRRFLALTGNDEVFRATLAWRPPLRVSPAAGGGTLGGGLRCALHALGG